MIPTGKELESVRKEVYSATLEIETMKQSGTVEIVTVYSLLTGFIFLSLLPICLSVFTSLSLPLLF